MKQQLIIFTLLLGTLAFAKNIPQLPKIFGKGNKIGSIDPELSRKLTDIIQNANIYSPAKLPSLHVMGKIPNKKPDNKPFNPRELAKFMKSLDDTIKAWEVAIDGTDCDELTEYIHSLINVINEADLNDLNKSIHDFVDTINSDHLDDWKFFLNSIVDAVFELIGSTHGVKGDQSSMIDAADLELISDDWTNFFNSLEDTIAIFQNLIDDIPLDDVENLFHTLVDQIDGVLVEDTKASLHELVDEIDVYLKDNLDQIKEILHSAVDAVSSLVCSENDADDEVKALTMAMAGLGDGKYKAFVDSAVETIFYLLDALEDGSTENWKIFVTSCVETVSEFIAVISKDDDSIAGLGDSKYTAFIESLKTTITYLTDALEDGSPENWKLFVTSCVETVSEFIAVMDKDTTYAIHISKTINALSASSMGDNLNTDWGKFVNSLKNTFDSLKVAIDTTDCDELTEYVYSFIDSIDKAQLDEWNSSIDALIESINADHLDDYKKCINSIVDAVFELITGLHGVEGKQYSKMADAKSRMTRELNVGDWKIFFISLEDTISKFQDLIDGIDTASTLDSLENLVHIYVDKIDGAKVDDTKVYLHSLLDDIDAYLQDNLEEYKQTLYTLADSILSLCDGEQEE